MKENRNDRQYGQTSSGQQSSESQSKQERMNREGSSSGPQMGSGSYEQEDSDTYVDQPQNRGRESNEGTFGSEGSPSSFTGRQRSGEYSPDDEIDDMDEMEDDDLVSRTDDVDDDDM